MLLTTLQLQQFRCFRETEWQFRPGINLIEGPNGSGKTSLLEALHYLCYLRSFRTFFTRELIQAGQTGFFVRAQFAATADPVPTAQTSLQIGFSPQKRIIKVAQREVQSYRELLALYTAISFVEDDLTLIKGEPSLRRTFLDQFIALYVPSYLSLLSDYKRTLVNR
ncbi:MAG TPA: AAA family ATPase, partial [Candidatus Babeliales bacterium]|nr:AAA family ATPase [Candidatus Babeliales bacterium]